MWTIVVLVAIGALVVALVILRPNSSALNIKKPPAWGTPETARLREVIGRSGPGRLIGQSGSSSQTLATVPPPRDERDFFLLLYGDALPRKSLGVVWRRWRCRPARPRPLRAPSVRIDRAPPEWTVVLADRCRICNRALTNATSMARGVGPDCYANYGARVVRAPNPSYRAWLARKAMMERERAAWQALLDEVHRRDMERYAVEARNWQAVVDLAGNGSPSL